MIRHFPYIGRSICIILAVCSLISCQKRSHAKHPSKSGLIIPTQPLPSLNPDGNQIQWEDGQISWIITINDHPYMRVNGLLGPDDFAELLKKGNPTENIAVRQEILAQVSSSLDKMEQAVNQKFLQKDIVAELGFYSMWIPYSPELWTRLQSIQGLPNALTLEAVTSDPKQLQRTMDQSEELRRVMPLKSGRDNNDAFSGLTRIGVTNDWLRTLEQDVGEKVDGSLTKIGITDTGITYNHPSFQDATGKPRIDYMKDFTQEGRVFFPNNGRFTVRLGTAEEAAKWGTQEENLVIAEDVTAHLNVLATLPPADGANLLSIPKETPILVSSDIRKSIQDGATARMGFLAEVSFLDLKTGLAFDLNHNSKIEDLMGFLLITPKGGQPLTDAKILVALDPVGSFSRSGRLVLNKRLDFTRALSLRDYSSSGDVAQSFAEKFGLDLENVTMLTKDGKEVAAIASSIVGYDSGVHGSHVAGIAAGRKTFQNDSDLTLARGVAPAARIYSARTCANTVGCVASPGLIDLALNAKVDVVNVSLGNPAKFNDGYDTDSLLIDRLSQITKTQFIVSAGNFGPALQAVASPSTARHAISVAASSSVELIDRQSQNEIPQLEGQESDFIMGFSSRGPMGNAGFKPDLTAPGTQLSAVSLNKPGRAGLDFKQGTSMAAPIVTGAYALLLDAARRYNKNHPNVQLPTDNMSLRRVMIGSTRPFDVKTFQPGTGKTTEGQYTWIDQGTGLINLPAAWDALKLLGQTRVPSGIRMAGVDISAVYEVRTQMTSRYGKVYDGKPAYGAGLWIDPREERQFYSIGIARRLPLVPEGTLTADQQGNAFAQLATTSESFHLTMEIHGSHVEWLKVNTLNSANSENGNRCSTIPSADVLTIVGQGALDGSSSIGFVESTMHVCIDREKLATLPKGDHGALIRAYRQTPDHRTVENVPAFIIPIYLNLPHDTLSGNKAFVALNSQVKAMGMSRNYLDVPADVSSLRVGLEVDAARKDPFGQAQNCSGVILHIQAMDHTVEPDGFANSLAYNCAGPGQSIAANEESSTRFSAEVVAPKAGLWDLHVEGMARVPLSRYQLRVDYLKAAAQVKEIRGGVDALNGSTTIEIKESSVTPSYNGARSSYIMNQATQNLEGTVKQDELVEVSNGAGERLRSYPADVSKVTVSTLGATGSNIDLDIQQCSLTGEGCVSLGVSEGVTDEESLTFVPKAGMTYKFLVKGTKVLGSQTPFQATEWIQFKTAAKGTVQLQSGSDATTWAIDYGLSKDDPLFRSEVLVKNPGLTVAGSIVVASDNLTLAVIPVRIRLN